MADKKNLYQRLLDVADEAGAITKDVQVTGFGGGYKGTSHDAVVKAVRDACVKHGVAVIPSVADFVETEVEFKNGTTAYKITVTMDTTFVNADNGEDRITARTVGIGVDSQDKGPGKAMSYAKKYALMMAFLMTTGDNDEERQPEPFRGRSSPRSSVQSSRQDANVRRPTDEELRNAFASLKAAPLPQSEKQSLMTDLKSATGQGVDDQLAVIGDTVRHALASQSEPASGDGSAHEPEIYA